MHQYPIGEIGVGLFDFVEIVGAYLFVIEENGGDLQRRKALAVGGFVDGVALLKGLHRQSVEFVGKIGADGGPAFAFHPVGFGDRVVIHRAVGEKDLNGEIVSGTAVKFRQYGGDRTVLKLPGDGIVAAD